MSRLIAIQKKENIPEDLLPDNKEKKAATSSEKKEPVANTKTKKSTDSPPPARESEKKADKTSQENKSTAKPVKPVKKDLPSDEQTKIITE